MAKPIRLAYLVSQYPRISETFILREVLALREMGFEIEVASINPPDRKPQELTAVEHEECGRTFYVKRTSWRKALWAHFRTFTSNLRRYPSALLFALKLGRFDRKRKLLGIFYFAEAGLIAHWMRQNDLSHLHVHFATPASTVGAIISKLTGASLSITVHGPDEFYDVTRYHLTEKIETCMFLCTIGKFARSQLMKLSPVDQWNKFEVTPLGVYPENFLARPPKERNGCFEILCVGRLVPAKGQHILIQAVDRLVKGGQNVRLRLVGDGPDRKSLEAMTDRLGLSKRTSFEGAVNQDRIQEFYRQADAFVLPSFAEGIPVVLMEAMAIQIPCVTTHITGIPELIRDGIDGLLVTASDEVELASTIKRLICEPELCRELGEAGRRRVLSGYDLGKNIRRLAEVFRRRLEA
ncbi:MAG: glycosyltransferase [Candidatus Sulfotelmatobacter sp.]|jgi:glycosyltransferase involved in cell wall biosynthesis